MTTTMTTAHVVTFHKCASNWFRRLFRDAATTHGANIRVANPNKSPLDTPVETGSQRTLSLFNNAKAETLLPGIAGDEPVILCLRDPKDVLISQYWSWKNTHQNNTPRILSARDFLNRVTVKMGLRHLTKLGMIPYCRAATTWAPHIGAGRVHILRYEDLLDDFTAAMGPALEAAGIPLDAAQLKALEEKYAFVNFAQRNPGEENQSSHYRKGVAGDWRNHFDTRLSQLFNDRYGALFDALGYARAEPDAALDQVPDKPEIVVFGFPDCETIPLLQAFVRDVEVEVDLSPETAAKIEFPQFDGPPPAPDPDRILARELTGQAPGNPAPDSAALISLCAANPHLWIVLCFCDPRKALVDSYLAWKETGKNAGGNTGPNGPFSLDAYYARHAGPRLRYDKYLLDLLRALPEDRLFLLSQESLALKAGNIVRTIKDATRGDIHPVPEAPEAYETDESLARCETARLSEEINSELYRIHRRLRRIIEERNLPSSL